jgi:PucR C-terminal helix-turn-helix domain/GGDEF-like domain
LRGKAGLIDATPTIRAEVRRTPEGRVSELVRRLLAEDGAAPEVAAELGYEVHEAWHLGLIATGEKAKESVRRLSMRLGCELLVLRRSASVHWVWLGTPAPLATEDVGGVIPADLHQEVRLAMGEPGRGIEGWRLTHRQAKAAMRLGMRLGKRITNYAEDPLLAAGLQDEVLSRSLQQIYLAPLGVAGERKGQDLRETLHAYFGSRCNAASAAAVLKVDRHTVERRLRTVEQLLGATPQACQAELTMALRLEELERRAE